MAARRRPAPRPEGPIAVQLPGAARIRGLHAALAAALGAAAALDSERLEQAMACAFDASTLGAGGCHGPAALVLLGFRDQRPAGALDPATGLLAALAILDANGFALGDVPYDEVAATLGALARPRPEQGEAEELLRWLRASTRPAEPFTAPLAKAELARLLDAAGLRVDSAGGRLKVLRSEPGPKGSWLAARLRRPTWVPVHEMADPGAGLVGAAAVRELRQACGLAEGPFLDDRAWAEGTVQHHRHLWPRLLGSWD